MSTNVKPISPAVHGVIDYGFSAALAILPSVLKLDKKDRTAYKAFAAGTVLYSLFTDYPAGLKHLIPFETHHQWDKINVSSLALYGLRGLLHKNKTGLAFTIGMVSAATMVIVLTDWKAKPK